MPKFKAEFIHVDWMLAPPRVDVALSLHIPDHLPGAGDHPLTRLDLSLSESSAAIDVTIAQLRVRGTVALDPARGGIAVDLELKGPAWSVRSAFGFAFVPHLRIRPEGLPENLPAFDATGFAEAVNTVIDGARPARAGADLPVDDSRAATDRIRASLALLGVPSLVEDAFALAEQLSARIAAALEEQSLPPASRQGPASDADITVGPQVVLAIGLADEAGARLGSGLYVTGDRRLGAYGDAGLEAVVNRGGSIDAVFALFWPDPPSGQTAMRNFVGWADSLPVSGSWYDGATALTVYVPADPVGPPAPCGVSVGGDPALGLLPAGLALAATDIKISRWLYPAPMTMGA